MATANVLELETCIAECITYCAANPKQEFVEFYAPRLLHARKRWVETVKESDAAYLAWQKDYRGERITWKKVGTELKNTQNALRKVNALGYPEETVRHWDQDILADAAEAMVAYLDERRDDLELAGERIEAIERALSAARSVDDDSEVALKTYKRYVLFRAEAMGTMSATIGDFRVSMRRSIGKKSEEYRSIRWPMTIAPDEPVL